MRTRPLLLTIPLCVLLPTLTQGDTPTTQPSEPAVYNVTKRSLNARNRPSWSTVTGCGTMKGINSGKFDRHYHDCNEYWLITTGKAKVWVAGRTYYIRDGDVVCTKAGDEHDVLEIYEPITGFYFEDALLPNGKPGHLHKTPADKAGHPVPTLPLPADFPKD